MRTPSEMHDAIGPMRARWCSPAGAWTLILLASAGCGGGPATSPPVDAERARLVLREALDAWKGGKLHESLSQQPSPIRVADEDWHSGARLLDYEMSPKDQVLGVTLQCQVTLSMKSKSGKSSKKLVAYNVTTAPSVIRQD